MTYHRGEPRSCIPVRLRGTEALGKLYRYTLDLATTHSPGFSRFDSKLRIDPDKLAGAEIDIAIAFDGKGVFIPGVPGDSGAGNIAAGVRKISGLVAKPR